MFSRNLLPVWLTIILVFGILLVGQNCPAQTGLCDSAPCDSIDNAVDGSCMEIDGSCTAPSDYSCACDQGYSWQQTTHTCKSPCTDNDQDGYGSPGSPSCTHPEGDCDDTDADVYPGAPELCDGIDNQCPGDVGYGDVDEGCEEALIPGDCFDMGDAFDEGEDGELPIHNVCITAFYMDIHEVTNSKYAECVTAGECTAPSGSNSFSRIDYYGNPAYDNFPVIYVDSSQAEDYCAWAGKRLPTEAEWEYAARGGLAGKRYPWGDTISGTDANYANSGDPWDNDTSLVGYYAPNGYGLYDMAGNVWEWVQDWYWEDYYSVSPPSDPPGPVGGIEQVFRGGSWNNVNYNLRVAYRGRNVPTTQNFHLGFRCARGGAYGP